MCSFRTPRPAVLVFSGGWGGGGGGGGGGGWGGKGGYEPYKTAGILGMVVDGRELVA